MPEPPSAPGADLLVRDVRLVDLDGAGGPASSAEPRDVLIRDGVIEEVGTGLRASRAEVVEGQGRWAIPGLWDQHVHLTQWALSQDRLDLSSAGTVQQAQHLVRQRLDAVGDEPAAGVLIGTGHRSVRWPQAPTVADLDAVSSRVPIVLISGDAHHGWMNTAALGFFGVGPREGVVEEAEWFALYAQLGDLPGADEAAEAAVARSVERARAQGLVGLVDLEWSRTWAQWQQRYAAGVGPMRVRAGVYPEHFAEVIAHGWQTGDLIPHAGGLVTMGPLKIITDGSLNTRTAWCCDPYADGEIDSSGQRTRGAPNLPLDDLRDLVAQARDVGLEAALHAIGDQAVSAVLDVFATTGTRGSIEHAQLVRPQDLPRWAGLDVRASVQPSHVLDDKEVAQQCWPERTDRSFMVRGLMDAGITTVLGSDAPVAVLDPWLTIASAVHRGPLDQDAWHPEQGLTPREALAASVDGQRLAPRNRGDVVLLDEAPYDEGQVFTGGHGNTSEQAQRLHGMPVSATIIAGSLAAGG